MDLVPLLRKVELFDGLTEDELRAVSSLCQERIFHAGDSITLQGEPGEHMFVICEGWAEVTPSAPAGGATPRAVVNLGRGQLIGEMTLVDYGPRSASVRAMSDPTVLQAIHREQFIALCEKDFHLGYLVMHNLAADLSFKLRHRNLTGR
jgi:CRP/FNR family transcriptional regulator, cyclic AMP receptor protein